MTGGGDYPRNRVDVYSMDGWMKELPELITGRYGHGCGHYINTDEKKVKCITDLTLSQMIFRYILSQGDGIMVAVLSNTYLLLSSWLTVKELGQLQENFQWQCLVLEVYLWTMISL